MDKGFVWLRGWKWFVLGTIENIFYFLPYFCDIEGEKVGWRLNYYYTLIV